MGCHVRLVTAVLVLTLLLPAVLSQPLDQQQANLCANAKTCGACIRTASVCAWCKDENFGSSQPRCGHYKLLGRVCPAEHVVYPTFKYEVIEDTPLEADGIVQVQPQAIKVTAKINEPVKLSVKFQQAKNYPVDLYFVLDFSFSMVREKDARDNLLKLGEALTVSMSNITKNFKLGFGSFVDKVKMPFIAWTPEMLKTRCPEGRTCRSPHDFKNQQSLTRNMTLFRTNMQDALQDMSQSLDDPEGGLDGLMQVLACEKEIGWRNRARRIIVYSTNSLFHIAGDGKLAGAVRPFDGQCHLDANGAYSVWDTILDYPSVSEVANLVRDKSANVIFVVMKGVFPLYKQLVAHLGDTAVIGELANNSGNIIQLVRDNYDKLRSKITFVPDNTQDIRFEFRSKCLGNVLRETNECDNLEIGDTVLFDITMTAESCAERQRTIYLNAEGLAERVRVDLELVCECDCEKPPFEQPNSPKCTYGNGTFECGKCTCNKNRYGEVCECDETQLTNNESIEKCKSHPNATSLCSGNGECVCGECKCLPIRLNSARTYSGKYCQCNDFDCAYYEGMLCGGPSRGRCFCGKCICEPDFTGADCSCSTRNETCVASNGRLCNDRGTCVCGKCQCNKDGAGYRGPTCEDCPTCPSKCNQFQACAQCSAFGSGAYDSDKCKAKCEGVQIVNEVKENLPDVKLCPGTDDDNCLFFYTYEYDSENNLIIKVQRTKACPAEAAVGIIVGAIVGGIVLLGLIGILLFIFIRRRQDAKEYADFLKEKERAKWESAGNPIYKDPKSTFQNPTYRGR